LVAATPLRAVGRRDFRPSLSSSSSSPLSYPTACRFSARVRNEAPSRRRQMTEHDPRPQRLAFFGQRRHVFEIGPEVEPLVQRRSEPPRQRTPKLGQLGPHRPEVRTNVTLEIIAKTSRDLSPVSLKPIIVMRRINGSIEQFHDLLQFFWT
jgi:hypothetical protein